MQREENMEKVNEMPAEQCEAVQKATTAPLFDGEDIKRVIPQRDPIMMVDTLVSVEGPVCRTQLTVRADNFFLDPDTGLLTEPGLLEHIAQSASAHIGYDYACRGEAAPMGFIGEVKKMHCYHRPQVGDLLETTVTMGPEVNDITLLSAETHVNGTLVADTQLKISTHATQG